MVEERNRSSLINRVMTVREPQGLMEEILSAVTPDFLSRIIKKRTLPVFEEMVRDRDISLATKLNLGHQTGLLEITQSQAGLTEILPTSLIRLFSLDFMVQRDVFIPGMGPAGTVKIFTADQSPAAIDQAEALISIENGQMQISGRDISGKRFLSATYFEQQLTRLGIGGLGKDQFLGDSAVIGLGEGRYPILAARAMAVTNSIPIDIWMVSPQSETGRYSPLGSNGDLPLIDKGSRVEYKKADLNIDFEFPKQI